MRLAMWLAVGCFAVMACGTDAPSATDPASGPPPAKGQDVQGPPVPPVEVDGAGPPPEAGDDGSPVALSDAGDGSSTGDGSADATDGAWIDASTDSARDTSSDSPGDARDGASDAPVDARPDGPVLLANVFAPGESGATYQVQATCRIDTGHKRGSQGCCSEETGYVLRTTCSSVLTESQAPSGEWTVQVGPMMGCVTTTTTGTCTTRWTGALIPPPPPCVGYTCIDPAASRYLGEPQLLEGRYVRAASPTAGWQYHGECGPTLRLTRSEDSPFWPGMCDLVWTAEQSAGTWSDLRRVGPGRFEASRGHRFGGCPSPATRAEGVGTKFYLGNATVATTYAAHRVMCTYELTML